MMYKNMLKVGIGVFTCLAAFSSLKGDLFSTKQFTNYTNMYQQAASIADDNELHFDYGNNNNKLDESELEGMAKDMGIVLIPNRDIPYKNLVEYVDKYSAN